MMESLAILFFYMAVGFLSAIAIYTISLWSIGAIASRRIAKVMKISRA